MRKFIVTGLFASCMLIGAACSAADDAPPPEVVTNPGTSSDATPAAGRDTVEAAGSSPSDDSVKTDWVPLFEDDWFPKLRGRCYGADLYVIAPGGGYAGTGVTVRPDHPDCVN